MTKGERQTQIPRHSDNLLKRKGLVKVNHQTRGKYWHKNEYNHKYMQQCMHLCIDIYTKIGIKCRQS